eukprot:gnl/MRDRNA2_/MRDRNA2_113949_c0_seq1.p1 gnl/MRDRNA2_/MRDRNA2_113949_c0~~gnl/MRDRNA2_/MRDRNA2_113949_c0_seq1.p1  ORF type:complete len:258 (+),score=51.66 gnl/MRDRNA2_/MRDRNA2_113949_c0_seq1:51-824(+)
MPPRASVARWKKASLTAAAQSRKESGTIRISDIAHLPAHSKVSLIEANNHLPNYPSTASTSSTKPVEPQEIIVDGKTLTSSQVTEFKETFALFDADGSGTVTAEELGTVMRSLGQYPSDADCRAMIAMLDDDSSGAINFEEFLRLMVAQMKEHEKKEALYSQREEFVQAFKIFDRDGNGYVDAQELRYMMQNHGTMRLTDDEVNEMMSDADVNGDGKLNFEEFIHLMMAPIGDSPEKVDSTKAPGSKAQSDIQVEDL